MKTCTVCGEAKDLKQFNKHRAQCKPCYNSRDKARKKEQYDPHKQKTYALKSKYGLTVEQYEQMLVDQNNQCYICNSQEKLFVDHCHESGKVRGLLCNHCNVMLGMAKDNPAILRLAANYLELAK